MENTHKCSCASSRGEISIEISPGKVSTISRLRAASLVKSDEYDIAALSLLASFFETNGVQIMKAEIDGKSILPQKMGAEMPVKFSMDEGFGLPFLCGPPPQTDDLDEISRWAAPLGLWREAIAAIFKSPLGE